MVSSKVNFGVSSLVMITLRVKFTCEGVANPARRAAELVSTVVLADWAEEAE